MTYRTSVMGSLLLLLMAMSSAAEEDMAATRIQRALVPYSGANSAARRYRYPIYNKRAFSEDADVEDSEVDLQLQRLEKRFMRGLNMRPLLPTVHRDKKRPHGITSSYDLSMTPYDMQTMSNLYKNGRKRSSDLYHLQDAANLMRVGRADPFTLMDAARLNEVGKRAQDPYVLLNAARLAQVGKRSPELLYNLQALRDHAPEELGEAAFLEHGDGNRERMMKRKFDDYFGWDRKKKDVGDEFMASKYYQKLKEELMGAQKNQVTAEQPAKKFNNADGN